MADSLFFAGDDVALRDALAESYRGAGWDVLLPGADMQSTLDSIAQADPVACILCFGDGPGDAMRDLALAINADTRMRPLFVFVAGTAEEVAQTKAALPYAVFVRPDELAWVLRRMVVKT